MNKNIQQWISVNEFNSWESGVKGFRSKLPKQKQKCTKLGVRQTADSSTGSCVEVTEACLLMAAIKA